MKRSLASPYPHLVFVIIALLALSGCGAPESNDEPDGTSEFSAPTGLSEQVITLRDGRQVTCVVYSGYKQGGTSCDWESANTDPRAVPVESAKTVR